MITAGAFPIAGDATNQAFGPRVGDGFIRLDGDGEVEYASPNALSAYRRLGLIGDLVDEHLATLTAELLPAAAGAGGRLGRSRCCRAGTPAGPSSCPARPT